MWHARARAEERAGRREQTKTRGGEGEVRKKDDGGIVVWRFGFRVAGSGLVLGVRV